MCRYKLHRKAMAMIELIFAIIVMAITLMSAPRLISIANESGFIAIQQESINEASSRANMILGYHWDENDADENYLDPLLVTDGDSNLSEYKNTKRRIGTPKESHRSFVREDGAALSATNAANLGLDAGEVAGQEDDIDDFDDSNISLVQVATSDADYIEKGDDILIHADVYYINDTLGSTETYEDPGGDYKINTFNLNTAKLNTRSNIKYINIVLSDRSGIEELNKTIYLNAFSCNIGAYKLEKRSY